MRRVILESPYAGSGPWPLSAIRRLLNKRYARRCLRDSLSRDEAPIASHLLYTQPGVLRDSDEMERAWGIAAGLAWGGVAEMTVVYVDRGISRGMQHGIENAGAAGRPVAYRSLKRKGAGGWPRPLDAAPAGG